MKGEVELEGKNSVVGRNDGKEVGSEEGVE